MLFLGSHLQDLHNYCLFQLAGHTERMWSLEPVPRFLIRWSLTRIEKTKSLLGVGSYMVVQSGMIVLLPQGFVSANNDKSLPCGMSS